MYRNLPTPTPRLLDCEARIVQPTLVKEFIRAVGPTAPRQHRDRINGESKVILASPQGILRHQRLPKHFGFSGGVCRLFQLGFHGEALHWLRSSRGASRPCVQADNPRTTVEAGRERAV